jgi:small-conductance mechanosensitive channel
MELFFTTLFIALIPIIGNLSSTLIPVIIACSSVIFGIAAKPFIENLICDLVLCFGKLARIGDIVLVDNEYGTIEDVTLTHCIIRRWDWLRYVAPNSSMMTKEFVNYSLHDNYRWVNLAKYCN